MDAFGFPRLKAFVHQSQTGELQEFPSRRCYVRHINSANLVAKMHALSRSRIEISLSGVKGRR